jgi:hypothetical protein
MPESIQVRDQVLPLRVSRAEKRRLETMAERRGVNLSDLLRLKLGLATATVAVGALGT